MRNAALGCALACAMALAGCASPVEDLTPFPCADDGNCPAGLACIPGVGCTKARLDAACQASTRCEDAAGGASCTTGICSLSCQDGAGCPEGRVCSAREGAGACLLDCATAPCPAGLSCIDLWRDGLRGCALSQADYPACLSRETLGYQRVCGQGNMSVACSTGGFCPTDSTCIDGFCWCNPGFAALSCAGAPCNSACTWPNFWCVPERADLACAAVNGWWPQVFHCADGRASPFDCGTPQSCETWCEAADSGCDTVTQNCTASAAPKCTITSDASGNGSHSCVASTGTLGPGETCSRIAEDYTGVGHDDCAAGGFCSAYGAPGGTRACSDFCRWDAQCPAGSSCLSFDALVPQDGLCQAGCELFSGCSAGMTCTPAITTGFQVVGHCRAVGGGGVDSACMDDTDCGADMYCESGACKPLCDAFHACPAGTTCESILATSLSNQAGICESDWRIAMSSGTGQLNAVWGVASNEVWAVGSGGATWRWNGSVWSRIAQWRTSNDLHDVWGWAGNAVWATGGTGVILLWNGSWTLDSYQAPWQALRGVSGIVGDVWAVGDYGSIMHWNGVWSSSPSGTTSPLGGVWEVAPNDVWAAGYDGTMLHFDGSAWSPWPRRTLANLADLWGSSASDIWAVGSGGGILHWDGVHWVPFSSGTTNDLNAVWGTAWNDVWAVGAAGTILHWDGGSWSKAISGTAVDLFGVWAASSTDAWAVGAGSTILHYQP